MFEEKFLPLDTPILLCPVEGLDDVAKTARQELRRCKRTNSQIEHVQNLIFELIEIYFHEEQEKEIQRLELEVRANFISCEDDADLYPFAIEHNRYGDNLVFVGDKNKLNVPSYDSLDEIEALYNILDWFKDNETEEGFLDAEPYEYFYALSLALVADAVIFINSFEKSMDEFGVVNINIKGLHPITRSAMKAMKAISYGNELKIEAFYECKLSYLNEEIEIMRRQITEYAINISVEEDRKKATIKKATDTRHKRSREARNIVCDDWLVNRNEFKSATAAAEYYKTWLEDRGYYYTMLVIRRWIFLHEKQQLPK